MMCRNKDMEDYMAGRTIKKAEVDGCYVGLTFDDGNTFSYSASDGGYSTYGVFSDTDEEHEIDYKKLLELRKANDMDENGLKPCPCCGSRARIVIQSNGEFADGYCVQCSEIYNCGLTQEWFDTEQEAIERWNKRC